CERRSGGGLDGATPAGPSVSGKQTRLYKKGGEEPMNAITRYRVTFTAEECNAVIKGLYLLLAGAPSPEHQGPIVESALVQMRHTEAVPIEAAPEANSAGPVRAFVEEAIAQVTGRERT